MRTQLNSPLANLPCCLPNFLNTLSSGYAIFCGEEGGWGWGKQGALWECAGDKSTFQTFRIDITMEYFPEQQKLSNVSLVFPVGKFRTDIRVPFLQTNL